MAILLGLDVGTTNIKAVLADSNGTILDMASCAAVVQRPFEGASEMDMELLWEKICGLTKQLKMQNPDIWTSIEGAGISAQGDGLWTVDKDRRPVGNAVLWNDTRTKELTGIDEAALDQLLIRKSSTALFAGAFPLILKWMKIKTPERYRRIDKVFRCKDWLNLQLTGNIVSDYTDFSTCGINIFTHEYVDELFEFLDIGEARGMMPDLRASTDIVGRITSEAADATGIPAGVKVITGGIDVVITSVGAGVTEEGESCCILGTTLCNEILINKGSVDINDRAGSALCSVFPGEYLRLMAALSGTSSVDWAKEILVPDLSFPELNARLEDVPIGSNGVLYHPYISGERAPFRNPFACGGFYGLTARHSRFDMMRAVFEGMALSVKDCFNRLPKADGKIYLTGGGSASDLSCRLIAGALNKEVLRPNREELGARGIIEVIKIALEIDDAEAQSMEKADVFEPVSEDNEKMESLYSEFVNLKDKMTDFWSWRSINNF